MGRRLGLGRLELGLGLRMGLGVGRLGMGWLGLESVLGLARLLVQPVDRRLLFGTVCALSVSGINFCQDSFWRTAESISRLFS
jgi:hypothetical protein